MADTLSMVGTIGEAWGWGGNAVCWEDDAEQEAVWNGNLSVLNDPTGQAGAVPANGHEQFENDMLLLASAASGALADFSCQSQNEVAEVGEVGEVGEVEEVEEVATVVNPRTRKPKKASATKFFPNKLRQLVLDALEVGCVVWSESKTAIVYVNTATLLALMPKYFKHASMRSFNKQLDNYGFVRTTQGFSSPCFNPEGTMDDALQPLVKPAKSLAAVRACVPVPNPCVIPTTPAPQTIPSVEEAVETAFASTVAATAVCTLGVKDAKDDKKKRKRNTAALMSSLVAKVDSLSGLLLAAMSENRAAAKRHEDALVQLRREFEEGKRNKKSRRCQSP